MLDDVFLQEADINDVDIVEHTLTIKPSKDNDLIRSIGVSRVPLSPVHEVKTL